MTIADVAARAGVSPSTVSRVLSGARRVSPEIDTRVRSAAKRLGYSVNPIARALRSQRTHTIGMVVPSISNPFFTGLVEQVEHQLGRHDLQLFLCDAQSDPVREAERLRSLVARSVDGVIISPVSGVASAAAISEACARVPVVQVDRFADGTTTDWVGLDDAAAMRLIVEHLAAGGVRTAVFAGTHHTNSSTERRQAGFERSAAASGIRVGGVLLGDYSIDWGEQVMQRLARRRRLPEAIVCADDLIALGVLRAARARGVAVPDDLVVTGFDDIPFAVLSDPALTTAAQPVAQIAAEAVRLLQDASGPRTPGTLAKHVALEPQLMVRGSTHAVPDPT